MCIVCNGDFDTKKDMHSFQLCFFAGILPPHQGSHDFVLKQRKQQYEDLHEALVAMQRITASTHQSEVFLKMFLVEEGLLPFEEAKMVIYNGESTGCKDPHSRPH